MVLYLKYVLTALTTSVFSFSPGYNYTTQECIPLVLDYNNVLQLAKMSEAVYALPHDGTDISIDNDTVKAYLFSNHDLSVNVVAIKGTTTFWGQSWNVYNDKFNDNLYFSCCFYQQSSMFRSLNCSCDNENISKVCCRDCYKQSTHYKENYMNIAIQIVKNLVDIIDIQNAHLTFTGHSLGGAVATMLGITFNKPVVTFESPGEKHYLEMIGYDIKSARNDIYHFGHMVIMLTFCLLVNAMEGLAFVIMQVITSIQDVM